MKSFLSDPVNAFACGMLVSFAIMMATIAMCSESQPPVPEDDFGVLIDGFPSVGKHQKKQSVMFISIIENVKEGRCADCRKETLIGELTLQDCMFLDPARVVAHRPNRWTLCRKCCDKLISHKFGKLFDSEKEQE